MNMEKKGTLIYWEVYEFKTHAEQLEDLGFKDYLPRNDAKTALIKSLRFATKGQERFYKKFADGKHEVRFAVVHPDLVPDVNGELDIDFTKELMLSLDKSSGYLRCTRGNDTSSRQEFYEKIQNDYRAERGSIDSVQFRMLVLKFIRRAAYGISMRSGGGIYFIDDRKRNELDQLQRLFAAFRSTCTLYEIPVYQDGDTMKALQDATLQSITGEVDTLLENLQSGNITQTVIKNRFKEVTELRERVIFHESTLRSEVDGLRSRIDKINDFIGRINSGEKVETFMDMLKAI